MGELMKGLKRSLMCGEVNESMVGKEVTLMGWVKRRRVLSQLTFILLRDRTGVVQAVIDETTADSEIVKKEKSIRSEYVVAIRGHVQLRDEININEDMKTGKVEISVDELRILSESETTPFPIEDTVNVNTELRLKYRYLDLRRS